ncbi:AAA family ATPase [Halobacterium salinarum]|uniref:Replication factor C small subunit n=3 Tax=Halobacterium salinarum TaxID=2242 RepID=Q9HN59_HALSA|nr:AAA family ATPase [Halobacterium salinarum]AAG20362.1 replication factor C small subunit [Halobacterium salinarum NRC-1]MBB6089713.1 replication factor C small subunit [Halobacterium salinarum]MDL0119894.1 AAA family ATPase [Halobacterium salinarum]MDL0135049.1 AAA family ATPase [Halobacterium salinarum]MDL0141829.1 AAA family ATPase [Halobacterium salinarum]
MDEPLWIDEHAPSLADLPQASVRDRLRDAVDEPVNLVVYGPSGAGKTAAVRALAAAAHDDPETDLVEVNVADVFGMTKTEISEDPRFASFIDAKRRRNSSKADLVNHVLKETASYSPVSGGYNTILLDNAEAIREDFQQALRRVMERHHEATQFIIATRQPSKLIPPIHSRCFPVSVRAPTDNEVVDVLREIVAAEGVDYEPDGLEFVAGYAEGDLREAVLGAQTTAEQEGEVTMNAAYEALQDVGSDAAVESMLDDAEAGAFTDARSTLDDLLVDEGMSGGEVLDDLLEVARSRYSGDDVAELYALAGDVEFDLTRGTSDRVQLGRLLAELGR